MEKVIATKKHTRPQRVFKKTKKGWTRDGFWKRLFGKANYYEDWMIQEDIKNGFLKEVK